MQRVPGVQAVAVVNNLPLSGANTAIMLQMPGAEPIQLPTRTISPQYFSVMGIPLVSVRAFLESDLTGSRPVAILNEDRPPQLFPDRGAVGHPLPPAPQYAPAT